MRYSFAPDVRRFQRDRVVLGGSPSRFVRLSAAGAVLVGRLASGEPVGDLAVAELGVRDRLVDAGVLVPEPEPVDGPFTSDDVTVVLPVHDRAPQLDAALAAIVAATSRPARLVVVDDGSTDPVAVAAVATRHGAEVIRRDRAGGPAAARNAGLAAVSTPLIAFVDSDVVVTPGWLGPLVALAGLDDVALVAPRVRSPEGPSVRERYDTVRAPLDLGGNPGPIRARSRLAYVPSAAIVCRADALRAVDGFDEAMEVGEDVDLCWRLADAGWRCRYAGHVATVEHHDEPERGGWLAWWRRRRDYGTSAAPLDRKHPGAVSPLGVSGWSAGAWSLVGAGHPVAGVAVAAGTTAALVRKLDFVDDPRVAAGLALRGHLGAGELIARALVRPWFPITVTAALVSRRARRLAVGAALIPSLADWVRRRPPIDPARWVAVSVADDVAYSCGVWLGAIQARSFGALRPTFSDWPGRSPGDSSSPTRTSLDDLSRPFPRARTRS